MVNEFDVRVDRRDMASIREATMPNVVREAGLVSLWGAEFDFKMPRFIIDGIKNWIDKGLIAYSYADEAYLSLVKNWMALHRNWSIEEEWIVPTYGLTFSVGTICRAFTNPGDGIIGMSPVYHMTWNPVELNDRVHVDCALLYDGKDYKIDFLQLEKVMARPNNKVFTLCSPHNPIGKVWSRSELLKIAALAIKYDVIVYSDEIFADTIFEGTEMLTFGQLACEGLKWIVATSIGKTYSITGIGQANLVIKDEKVREAFILQRDKDHYGSFDPMMRAAYFAGYTQEGHQWIREMMSYCYKNYRLIHEFITEKIPEMKVIKPEGTYLLWIDCRGLNLKDDAAYKAFFDEALFTCDQGTTYNSEPGFIRTNIACPREDVRVLLEHLYDKILEKRMEEQDDETGSL